MKWQQTRLKTWDNRQNRPTAQSLSAAQRGSLGHRAGIAVAFSKSSRAGKHIKRKQYARCPLSANHVHLQRLLPLAKCSLRSTPLLWRRRRVCPKVVHPGVEPLLSGGGKRDSRVQKATTVLPKVALYAQCSATVPGPLTCMSVERASSRPGSSAGGGCKVG